MSFYRVVKEGVFDLEKFEMYPCNLFAIDHPEFCYLGSKEILLNSQAIEMNPELFAITVHPINGGRTLEK